MNAGTGSSRNSGKGAVLPDPDGGAGVGTAESHPASVKAVTSAKSLNEAGTGQSPKQDRRSQATGEYLFLSQRETCGLVKKIREGIIRGRPCTSIL